MEKYPKQKCWIGKVWLVEELFYYTYTFYLSHLFQQKLTKDQLEVRVKSKSGKFCGNASRKYVLTAVAGILLMITVPPVARPASNPFLAIKFSTTFDTILILIPEISIKAPPRGERNLGGLYFFLVIGASSKNSF